MALTDIKLLIVIGLDILLIPFGMATGSSMIMEISEISNASLALPHVHDECFREVRHL